MSENPGRIEAGRVGRAHGLDGSFYVTRPRTALLEEGMVVELGGRKVAITRRAGTEQRPIVRVDGVEDRGAAEALRGQPLTIAQHDMPRLAEGEWWEHELASCRVFDGEELLGTVSGLMELPSCEALEVVRSDGGGTVLVPLVKDAIRQVDIAGRRIDVDLAFLGLDGGSPPTGDGDSPTAAESNGGRGGG